MTVETAPGITANRQVVLLRRPSGPPVADDFELRSEPLRPLRDGEFRIRNRYFAIEPAIRGWLDDGGNYFEPVRLGDAVRSPTLGHVVDSRHADYTVGDCVRGLCRWEEYSILSGETVMCDRLEPRADVPLSYYAGALSGSGLSAYIGLHEIGRVEAGSTVVVSAAAGAVGSLTGQIARLRGARTVGLVGSDEKGRIAREELGFDAVVNYRACPDLAQAVREACPEGVDIYFDSVGGAMLNAMLTVMNTYGRIVACGMISGYNNQKSPPPVYNLWEIVARELEMKGFLLPSYTASMPEAVRTLEQWIAEGAIKVIENKMRGIEKTVPLFCDLMSGDTIGKAVLELDA